MIKCIMLDLDGTLLNSSKRIDTKTLEALVDAGDKRLVVLISGRHFKDMQRYIQELSVLQNICAISCDGLYIHAADGSCLWENSFLSTGDIAILGACIKPKRMLLCTTDGDRCVVPSRLRRKVYKFRAGLTGIKGSFYISPEEIRNIKENSIEKVIVPYRLGTELETQLSENYCVHNFVDRCELLAHCVNKYAAASSLCEMHGIVADEVLYFGDDINDIECFRQFPNCVAMGNAVDELKLCAKWLTEDNDSNGIAIALKKYLF